jgi:HAD superfamily hydrolase (TIGR01450 family)
MTASPPPGRLPARGVTLSGTWAVDLDGVVWLSGEPIGGSGEAVARLRDCGVRVLFVSNNSSPTVADLIHRLAGAGIVAAAEDVVTSGQAAAGMLDPGTVALVVGDRGLIEALEARGVEVVLAAPRGGGATARPGRPTADVVVVGWTRQFDFDVVARASAAVRSGARLIGTNDDATLPTPAGLLPGAGALLAAVATASGVSPAVAGKPHEPIARLVVGRAGPITVAVGDRPSTDGALARQLGAAFALVLSGVTAPSDDDARRAADLVADDLAAVVAAAGG